MAKGSHWWQMPDVTRMCEAIRKEAAPYKSRIAYGTSMGGYGSLMLGREMGCTRVIAVSPQTTIRGPLIKTMRSWASAIKKYPIIRDCVEEDLGGLIPEIIIDPYRPIDWGHLERLRQVQAVRHFYYFPFAGHKLLETLKECNILGSSAWRLFRGAYSELLIPSP